MAEEDYTLENQPYLFPLPLDAVICDPERLGTADCSTVCRCSDGCDYAIKDRNGEHALTPHAEWFCTHLADLVGLAGAPCRLVRMHDGAIAFGSRWEGGVLDRQRPWYMRVKDQEIPLHEVAPVLSRIFAFDHFVHNWDRHAGNFLFRESRGSHVVLSFDYSRAWVCNGFPLPELPFTDDPADIKNHTRILRRQLAGLWGREYLDPRSASEILENIRRVRTDHVRKIIEDHPKEWLPPDMKTSILDWWNGEEMKKRIDGIEEGISNGRYL